MHTELKGNTGWLYTTLTHLQNCPMKCVLQTEVNFVQHNVEVPKFWLFWLSHTRFCHESHWWCETLQNYNQSHSKHWNPGSKSTTFTSGCVKEAVYTHPFHCLTVFNELKICIRVASEYTKIQMLPSICMETDYCLDMCQITNGVHSDI